MTRVVSSNCRILELWNLGSREFWNPGPRKSSHYRVVPLTASLGPQTQHGGWKKIHPTLVVVQSLSRALLSRTPWTAAHQASLSFAIFRSLLKLVSIESMTPSNHVTPCHPLLLLPSIFPNIRGFSRKSVRCIRWPLYWSFGLSISPCSDYSGFVSSGLIDRWQNWNSGQGGGGGRTHWQIKMPV